MLFEIAFHTPYAYCTSYTWVCRYRVLKIIVLPYNSKAKYGPTFKLRRTTTYRWAKRKLLAYFDREIHHEGLGSNYNTIRGTSSQTITGKNSKQKKPETFQKQWWIKACSTISLATTKLLQPAVSSRVHGEAQVWLLFFWHLYWFTTLWE